MNKSFIVSAPLSGPQKAMQRLGLVRPIDLALHLPLRYEDETRLIPFKQLQSGQVAQVEGIVVQSEVELKPRRQLIVRLKDAQSHELVLRFLHFYASQQKSLAVGQRIRAMGEARVGFWGVEMVHPTFKVVTADTPLAKTLTPIYPASAQLPQAYLRKAVASGLQRAHLDEVIPPHLIPSGLPTLRAALQSLHYPAAGTPLDAPETRSSPEWQRLQWDELLAQQLSQLAAQKQRALRRAPPLTEIPMGLAQQLQQVLPFNLTAAQQRVAAEIMQDMAKNQPMHRLLQGDVGSGKTVVAAMVAAVAIDAGWQCALMAPTEILADQHFRKLVHWLQPLLAQRQKSVAWLSGSVKGKARKAMLEATANGQAALIIGTHAVIQDQVQFHRLGLAIIDEQHRFGVAQRLALRQKLEESNQRDNGLEDALPLEPHLLMMSATPIPRTLAMTYYADLALSTIDELPPGRTPIITKVFSHDRRLDVIGRIRDEAQQGRQAYWVCPLIEESEALDLQNATEAHALLSEQLHPLQVGLLHGRMSATEKAATMALFEQGQTHVLVATTVIEVGVDVPNASLMVIEHAERFGLSQLHQLRGRVGRGSAASVCVLLFTGPLSLTGKARLRAMAETNDGFEISRRDLEIRGPGEFMGARQSGDALLRFADLHEGNPLLQHAREIAPVLWREYPAAAQKHTERWLSSRSEYLKA